MHMTSTILQCLQFKTSMYLTAQQGTVVVGNVTLLVSPRLTRLGSSATTCRQCQGSASALVTTSPMRHVVVGGALQVLVYTWPSMEHNLRTTSLEVQVAQSCPGPGRHAHVSRSLRLEVQLHQ
jgi:hypothetical protein